MNPSLEQSPILESESAANTPAEHQTDATAELPTKADIPPTDKRELTIKNLDTGEEFIIGENDPDFEFDTFEIKPQDEHLMNGNNDMNETNNGEYETILERKQNNENWWINLFNFIYASKSSSKKQEEIRKKSNEMNTSAHRPKTPFTKLSSFKFKKELGKGAFGRVLLAEAKTDGKLYALKIIAKKNMRTSDKRQAKAERDILHAMAQKAPHPFTSGLKFAFQSENNLYLGMDYIPGGNLRELIKKFKFLPEDWVRFYAAELVLAISHLHSLNVLYRDIKPHNVMIDARGHVILIDFGLSKQEISHPRGALSLVGTPDYSAPEVLKTGVHQIEAHNKEKRNKKINKKDDKNDAAKAAAAAKIGYGKAADWWSLGIMIYEMLSGTPTFRGPDLRQTYQRVLFADLEFSPEERFSESSRLLLSGLIERDPNKRLGFGENPPRDIMSSPFFGGIEWDEIYERKYDGPWIPEVQYFDRRSSHGNVNASSEKSEIGGSKLFSPTVHGVPGSIVGAIGGDSSMISDSSKVGGYGSTQVTPVNISKKIMSTSSPHDNGSVPLVSSKDSEEDGEENDDEEDYEDNDDDDENDLMQGMRDSIFITSTRATNSNKLMDWSFIDEKVLSAANSSGKKSKFKKRVDPKSTPVTPPPPPMSSRVSMDANGKLVLREFPTTPSPSVTLSNHTTTTASSNIANDAIHNDKKEKSVVLNTQIDISDSKKGIVIGVQPGHTIPE